MFHVEHALPLCGGELCLPAGFVSFWSIFCPPSPCPWMGRLPGSIPGGGAMSDTPQLARGIFLRAIVPGSPVRYSRVVDYWPDRRDVPIIRRAYRAFRRAGIGATEARRLIRALNIIRTVA